MKHLVVLIVCVHELLFKQRNSQDSFEESEETEQHFAYKVIVSWSDNKEQLKNNKVKSAILYRYNNIILCCLLLLERLSRCISADVLRVFFSFQVC